MPHLPISVDAPLSLILAAICGAATVAIAGLRRIVIPPLSRALGAGGMICLILAAGSLTWNASRPANIAVMVDLSASTRTATYHDRAALERRLSQLLDGSPYKGYAFAANTMPADLAHLQLEVDGNQTVFDPPPADAIVLFSDAQFALPKSAPPIYVVIDPALDHVDDAAVNYLRERGHELSAGIANAGDNARQVTFTNAAPTTLPAPPGDTVVQATLAPDASEATATLSHADAWPENDALSIRVAPPMARERWWISAAPTPPAPAGWRSLAPAQVPSEESAYLNPAIIVLNNLSVNQINRSTLVRMEQYVRDLGGGLVILGGDHAFAGGGYQGSQLNRLSPLASNPPAPATRWVLLVDSSGSMAASIGDNSRWNFAVTAMVNLIPLLPQKDTVDIGDFARDVRWWATATPMDRIDPKHLVPSNVHPNGPTNLQPVLEQLARSSNDELPTQVLIVTDAEASIDDPERLGDALAKQRIHVNVLSNAPLPPTGSLARLIQRTGGFDLADADPRQWSGRLQELLRSTSPRWLEANSLPIRFTAAGPHLPAQQASPWNRTWLKAGATELANGLDKHGDSVPAVAAWNVGDGSVLATAFTPSAELAEALSAIVATPPRDPRFTAMWETGREFRVTLDAIDGQHFLNDLKPTLVLSSGDSGPREREIPQISPGRYELSIHAPRRQAIARLMLDHHMIDRIAVADRYAPEFDAIGNDRAAMRALATQTGGEVIEPSRFSPIDFPLIHERAIPLTAPLAALGAALIAGALVRWRLG